MSTSFSNGNVHLVPLKSVGEDELQRLVVAVAGLSLAPGQDDFVGEPAAMLATALEDTARHPFAIVTAAPPSTGVAENAFDGGTVVGLGVLHLGAALEAGWPNAGGAVLLRGFLIDKNRQGRGYGSGAAVAAVELAQELVRASGLSATGLVLSVNERNPAGLAAYLMAKFVDRGQHLGGRSGSQRILYRAFDAETIAHNG
ncbi:GNAT family N-acetyltransferase [Arthrobacter sp. E3]|uniref:GNAT family N-acetyltransferase n=1 Tax=Arthrobacter sp. E3 TaxID=517402 RepID=UPI001FFD4CE7|nr:GNAT family N-acetyltransferase [Arthrobacter sp. E3]